MNILIKDFVDEKINPISNRGAKKQLRYLDLI